MQKSNWIIIGSVAANHWFADYRMPSDIDVLSETKIAGRPFEVKWHRLANDLILSSDNKIFADPEILLTLKLSHAYWDIHWNKTVWDVNFFQEKGIKPIDSLHDELVKMWEEIHGKKKVNLRQPLDEFFGDTVKRKYDHEWLHEQMAYYHRPLHEAIRPDLTSPYVCKKLFFLLPKEDQLKAALEEIMVIAVERWNLTSDSSQVNRITAFNSALKKLATTATKGWFARFLIENHKALVTYPWREHLHGVLNKL